MEILYKRDNSYSADDVKELIAYYQKNDFEHIEGRNVLAVQNA